jgi:hypothetical protein
MEPLEAYYRIREACLRRPELKYKDGYIFDGEKDEEYFKNNRYMGFCYVATFAFCNLVDRSIPYTTKDKTHYWAQIGDKIWDLTAEQFKFIYPYNEGRRVPRKKLTKRTQLLLEEALERS